MLGLSSLVPALLSCPLGSVAPPDRRGCCGGSCCGRSKAPKNQCCCGVAFPRGREAPVSAELGDYELQENRYRPVQFDELGAHRRTEEMAGSTHPRLARLRSFIVASLLMLVLSAAISGAVYLSLR